MIQGMQNLTPTSRRLNTSNLVYRSNPVQAKKKDAQNNLSTLQTKKQVQGKGR